jgi:hypothetical protein
MDVIALGKATKAKKAIKSLNDRLGEGVEDVYTNVKTRLEELEKKDPHVTLYNRVSEVEANNAINLNKHNLHVNTILNKSKFGLTDLAFDDFADATGIDATKSTGQVFDAVGKKFVINPAATEAELVTTVDSLTDTPQMITISQVFNEQNTASDTVDLANGVHMNTELVNGKIQLFSEDGINFTPSGSYVSPVLDIGTNFKTLQKINQVVTIPASTGITISTVTSADSITFSEYLPVNTDNTIASPSARYIKVKVDLAEGGQVTSKTPMDFVASEASNFPVNDKVIFDGSLHMKTAYVYSMNPDASFIETGTLLKKTINRSNYKTIEKIEVK